MSRSVLAAALLVGGCGAAEAAGPMCIDYLYEDQFAYDVHPAWRTAGGIAVDPSGQALEPELVDRLTDEVERCLAESFGDPPQLPPDVRAAADCLDPTFALPIARECLVVKVPADWQPSCDGAEQVLPSHAPDALCRAKGLEPTAECPCRWRAGIQDGHVLVTTPSFHMFKDPLVRLATGCNNPWAHPALARCAMPDP